jgi:hypothetical protein
MKYSRNCAGEQAEFDARAKEDPGARTRLPMRVPCLRYRDSLRKNNLRAPLEQNYAESNADSSFPFRLNSFSTHSTKNS